jgi:hypothetical protein
MLNVVRGEDSYNKKLPNIFINIFFVGHAASCHLCAKGFEILKK